MKLVLGENLVITTDNCMFESERGKLLFFFCHNTTVHNYTVQNKENLVVWQGKNFRDALEEFNNLA